MVSQRPTAGAKKITPEISVLNQMIAVGTGVLEIPMRPEWLDAVRFHLEASLGHAANVQSFTLPDEAEPAVIFRA